MKKFYYIAGNFSEKTRSIFLNNGIKVPLGFGNFTIPYNHSKIDYLFSYLKSNSECAIIRPFARFSKKEILESNVLNISGLKEVAKPFLIYDESTILNTYYNTSNFCNKCGRNYFQDKDFIITNPIKWGKYKIGSFQYIFDEIIVEKDFYYEFLSDLGIDCRSIYINNSETISDNAVQLIAPIIQACNKLNTDFDICSNCQQIRYTNAPVIDFLPEPKTNFHFFKTIDWIGSGYGSWHRLFISSSLRDILIKNNIIWDRYLIPTK